MENLFKPPEKLREDECCICGSHAASTIRINREYFPFCTGHSYRADLLREGQIQGWPAVKCGGYTGTYALENCAQSWAFTALFGTDERVIELLDALDDQIEKVS